jgi:hemolysin III
MTAATGSRQHRAGEVAADRIIHIMGTLVGVVGSAILVGIAALSAARPVFYASVVYSFCLLLMLSCSAAYHLASNASRRGFLRQLDHAAIFLMIAGTCTPFTICRLQGVWAMGMTGSVWTGAVTGAVMKLICPRSVERVSIVAHLALGWMILVGIRPFLGSVEVLTAVLMGVGGVLYSIGVGFHVWRALPFQKAI